MEYALDSLPQAVTPQEMNDDLAAYWYAWGRIDQGAEPIVTLKGDGSPSGTATAWVFSALYMQAARELADNDHPRLFLGGIQACWENFVASQGQTVDHQVR